VDQSYSLWKESDRTNSGGNTNDDNYENTFYDTLLSLIRWMIPYHNFWKLSPDLKMDQRGIGSCRDVSTRPCDSYGTPTKVGRVFESRIFVNWKNKLRRTILRKRQDQRLNSGEENKVKNYNRVLFRYSIKFYFILIRINTGKLSQYVI
jgi:hypothetical protein